MTFREMILPAAMAMLAAGAAIASPVGPKSFEGQTIRITVNASPGSSSDLLCRLFAPAIGKHIPGKPTVVVENRPGAGGLVAANHFFNAVKPDGMNIGLLFGVVTPGLIGGDNVRFTPGKFRWLGAIASTQVLLARKDLKISETGDLLRPAMPLVLASAGTSSTNDMATRLFLDMIGARYRHVTGFPGQPEQILALTRGEVNLVNASLPIYLPRRESIRREGLYDAIVQRGERDLAGNFRRNALIPEIPTMIETIEQLNPAAVKTAEFATYRSIVGAFRINFGFMLPPGANDQVVEVLSAAIAEALDDPEVREQVRQKFKVDYDFIDGPAAQLFLTQLGREFDADPRIGALVNLLMSKR